MIVDLVHTLTADGLRLDGALHAPSRDEVARPLDGDAVVLVHGTGANFYGSSLLERLAEKLAAAGLAALRVNTRGHDLMSTAHGTLGPRRQGAAAELVDDCRYDLAAWVGFLRERGWPRVTLLGHSLGALKSVYALAEREGRPPLPPVERLVAISPPRLSYARFAAGARAEEFLRDYQAAARLVESGAGDELLPIRFPIPYAITAQGYVDKYGPAERYNLLSFVERVPVPTLFTFGEQELRGNVAFAGLADELEALDPERGRWRVDVLAGADHFYAGAQSDLWARIERWWRATPAANC